MAGFEVVVRPVVFPNIRVASPRVLPPEDDPTKGFAVIGGGGGGALVSATNSWSVSLSRQRPKVEVKRQFDKEKVNQEEEDGTINRDNFVILERLKKILLEGDDEEGPTKMKYADPPPRDNVEVLEKDVTRKVDPP